MQSYQQALDSIPSQGLFRDEELPFHLSPQPLMLPRKVVKQLERLGPTLLKFQMACDRLYKRSRKGTITPWIAETLDHGKPDWLLTEQSHGIHKNALPRVIRPDLLLTEQGLSLTEIDSVPGGIGLTHWLSTHYDNPLGAGILTGFRSLCPSGMEIHLSEESADYRAEMTYLADALSAQFPDGSWSCLSAEEVTDPQQPVYRFFELFDWEQLPNLQRLFTQQEVTPPLKPHLEEKLWLALYHTPALAPLWREELRERQLKVLDQVIPPGWVVDPTPLPPHASLPRLPCHSWDAIGQLSQRDRQLVLKVSGFSDQAWGSRGVTIGHDCSGPDWQSALAQAQANFTTSPSILQEFADTKLIDHPYYDPTTGAVKTMRGRVRLCPYYFVSPDYQTITLGAVLATINPADKKKIHGMRDAILTVAAAESD